MSNVKSKDLTLNHFFLCTARGSGGAGQPIRAGMGELFSPAQLHASVCAAAVFLGATDEQVPAGATTRPRDLDITDGQRLDSIKSLNFVPYRSSSLPASSHALR
jgi:hypothetical protein